MSQVSLYTSPTPGGGSCARNHAAVQLRVQQAPGAVRVSSFCFASLHLSAYRHARVQTLGAADDKAAGSNSDPTYFTGDA